MAFEPTRLKAIGGQDNEDFGGDLFSYTPSVASADTMALILGTNFFLPAFESLNINDVIKVMHPTDGDVTIVVTASIETSVVVRTEANAPFASISFSPVEISVVKPITRWTLNNVGNTAGIVDGYEGQVIKVIIIATNAQTNTGVITPDNRHDYASITLTGSGAAAEFMFTGGAWLVLSASGETLA